MQHTCLVGLSALACLALTQSCGAAEELPKRALDLACITSSTGSAAFVVGRSFVRKYSLSGNSFAFDKEVASSNTLSSVVIGDGHLFVGGNDNDIQERDIATLALIGAPKKWHESYITHIAYAKEMHRFVSADGVGRVAVWSTDDIAPEWVFNPHKDSIRGLIQWDGETFISCGLDKMVIAWNISTKKILYSFISSERLLGLGLYDHRLVVACEGGIIEELGFGANGFGAVREIAHIENGDVLQVCSNESLCLVSASVAERAELYRINSREDGLGMDKLFAKPRDGIGAIGFIVDTGFAYSDRRGDSLNKIDAGVRR